MSRKRSFFLLLSNQSIASAGDIFYLVSIISVVYERTSSVFLVSLIPFINTFSRFLGGLFAPWILEKGNLRPILAAASTGKGLLLMILPVLLPTGVGSSFLMWALTVVGLIAVLDSWITPARNAFLPRIVPRHSLVRANSLMAMSDQSIQLAGWPVGALFIVLFPPDVVLMGTSLTFMMISFLLLGVRIEDSDASFQTSSASSMIETLQSGWRYVWKHRPLRTMFIVDGITSLTGAIWIAALLYVYVADVLQENEPWWGYINASFFAGLIIGGMLCFRFEIALQAKARYFLIGSSFCVAVFTFWFAFPASSVFALLISLLIGIPTQVQEVTQITLIQAHTEEKQLAKVFSARDVILTSFFGFSSLLVGGLAEIAGVRSVFIIASVLLTISGLIYVRHRNVLLTSAEKEDFST
ncbi:MFS transporter [Marinococcus sp. PL1-022]|uniref:MFS transporter n=1 Tax=Marinococcus sp. PL1-022 TaxID=3095363 RepID=UPI0029C53BD2|nr:MFS transporter [Marinococcus sp. PL1-022]MDX6153096.1 MFS transporter [Marinococcus sp. PL1-022]